MLDASVTAELRTLLAGDVVFDEPLSRHTSLRVGGPADALAQPPTRAKLVELSKLCRAHGLPVLVLGKGFNTLVRDGGVRGVVVRLHALRAISRDESECVDAEAGVTHTTLTRFCADEGLSGLEFAVGIPGTVGGWLRMNAGIPDREMRHVTESLSYLDPVRQEIVEVPAANLAWAYRQLVLPEGAILVAGRFQLEPAARDAIRVRMQQYLERRRETQPIDQLSCGSVFVNPPQDHAGRLIEAAGLKGEHHGAARISDVHANFIVNEGGASAADVLVLIERAREAVRKGFGVALETEVRIVGEDR